MMTRNSCSGETATSSLLERGVDASLKTNSDNGEDCSDMTALDIAIAQGHQEVVAPLWDHGG
jgi:hypothetical protein